jgi:hypothetical protein
MANLINIMTAKQNTPPQRVDEPPTSEGVPQEQRVGSAPLVTTRTPLTVPVVIQTTAQAHKRTTIHNTTGITMALNIPETSVQKMIWLNPTLVQDVSTCTVVLNAQLIPFFLYHTTISQETVYLVIQRVWDTPGEEWTPTEFLDHKPKGRTTRENFHDVDIDHIYAAMVPPDTGKASSNTKGLNNIPTRKEGRCVKQNYEKSLAT